MKILKATTAYNSYLKRVFRHNALWQRNSYIKLSETFFEDGFGWSNFWQKSLAQFDCHVLEIVANAKPIQYAWACENGFRPSKEAGLADILIAQVKQYKPDILFLENHTLLTKHQIQAVRQQCPSIRLVVSWCSAPFENRIQDFAQHDLVLSCIPEIVKELKESGLDSEHINHAFYPEILERAKGDSMPSIPLSFVGQIVQGNQQHMNRLVMLEAIAASSLPLQIYTPSCNWSIKSKTKHWLKQTVKATYPLFKRLEDISFQFRQVSHEFHKKIENSSNSVPKNLLPYCHQPVFGLSMFETLKRSSISLNCHIDISRKSASNMRLFEATGMGSCLLTDAKQNLHMLFEPDYEVVTYASPEECIEKAKWLLAHPEKRKEIAIAGQKKTLTAHTFQCRALELMSILRRYLK